MSRTVVTVAVPTWRRPDDLTRCLMRLQDQQRAADEVLLVIRPDDHVSLTIGEAWADRLPVRVVAPPAPGFMPALRTAFEQARGDLLALLDDDAAPHADWLHRLVAAFDQPDVVAVGGINNRVVDGRYELHSSTRVGRLSATGRMTGMHYARSGLEGVPVDHLQGCNMGFRRPWPLPDLALRGVGVYNELDLCLRAATRGRIWYDERIAVDHHLGIRHETTTTPALARADLAPEVVRDASWNYAYVLAKNTAGRRSRWLRLVRMLVIGHRPAWGLLRGVAQVLCGPSRRDVARGLPVALEATAGGWRAGAAARRDAAGPQWSWRGPRS